MPNIFRTPGINGSAGVSGVNSFLQGATSPDKFIAQQYKKAFNEALNEAIKRLSNKKNQKCAALFGGQEAAIATLQNTEYRVLTLPGGGPKLDPKTGNYSVTGAQTNGPNSVFINDKGPFFDQRLPLPEGGFKIIDMGTGRRGRDFGALLLLHELGHQTGVFLSDSGDSKLNRSQTDKVLKACF
ncbi:MAG: hypothetical protein HOP19_16660 [Acidobacteria bacterium]|nr:hypothetical protein [Acidobacteriota bacterium]